MTVLFFHPEIRDSRAIQDDSDIWPGKSDGALDPGVPVE
jgi:hypothetical protein